MKRHLNNYFQSIKYLFGFFVLLTIVCFVINYYSGNIINFYLPIEILYYIDSILFLLTLYFYQEHTRIRIKILSFYLLLVRGIDYLMFSGLFLICFHQILKNLSITFFDFTENGYFVGFFILLGSIFWWLNAEKITDQLNKNKQEKCDQKINLEPKYLSHRLDDISDKSWQEKVLFTFNQIIFHLKKWIIEEGKYYIIFLFSLLVIGFCLRIFDLGKLGYSTDEGSAAKYSYFINQSGLPCSPDGICYYTGPYFYFISLFTKIFGVSELWVRLPGVIITIITLGVVYFLVKKITSNKNIGLLSVIIIVFADWHIMLGRYARQYGLMLFFVILALFYYYKTFYEKKLLNIIPLLLFIAFALLTHQLSFLLIFLILEPFFNKNIQLYKNKWFMIFSVILLILIYLSLTKISSHFTYYGENYIGYNDLKTIEAPSAKFWYLEKIQLPDWAYVKKIFIYFPLAAILIISFITTTFIDRKFKANNLFFIFVFLSFIIMSVYKIEYSLKYLWWFLVIFYICFAYCWYCLYLINQKLSTVLLFLALIPSAFGINFIFSRQYGSDEKKYPLLMNSHVEEYYPDDKTIVQYVLDNYQKDDIIITDYWIQNVYLLIAKNMDSQYFISPLDGEELAKKYVVNKFYQEDENTWRLSKSGPVIISDVNEFIKILQKNQQKRIWYISSADFNGRRYEGISNWDIIQYIKHNLPDSIQYVSQDKKSKAYLFTPPKN